MNIPKISVSEDTDISNIHLEQGEHSNKTNENAPSKLHVPYGSKSIGSAPISKRRTRTGSVKLPKFNKVQRMPEYLSIKTDRLLNLREEPKLRLLSERFRTDLKKITIVECDETEEDETLKPYDKPERMLHHRSTPTLSRIPRIESDSDLPERENVLDVFKTTLKSVLSDSEKLEKTTNTDSELIRRKSYQEATTSKEKTQQEKESPRTWIPKSVSKMLSERQISQGTEKKRSKSPSGILEYAQRKLPKWATFSRKSDEDINDAAKKQETNDVVVSKAPKLSDIPKTAKAKSAEVPEESPLKFKQQSGSDEDKSITSEGDSEQRSVPKSTFSLFKGKFKGKGEQTKVVKEEKIIPRVTTVDEKLLKRESNLRKTESNVSEYESERKSLKDKGKKLVKEKSNASEHESERKSLKDKGKKLVKEKSKESKPPMPSTSRKGSFKRLKNFWAKDKKKTIPLAEQPKAISADALNCNKCEHNHLPFSDNEIILTSTHVYVLTPETQVEKEKRSLSLSHLDVIMNKSKLVESDSEMSLHGLNKALSLPRVRSLPCLDAVHFNRAMPYASGSTKGKSAFVRQNNGLKHTHSQGETKDYFQLCLPDDFDINKLIFDRIVRRRKVISTVIFVPAVGNVSLREAVDSALHGHINFDELAIHIEGFQTPLPLDRTDTGHLAGRTVVLQEKKSKKVLSAKNTFQRPPKLVVNMKEKLLSKSTDDSSGKGNRPEQSFATPSSSSERQDQKSSGFPQKLNQILGLFGTKTDPVKMEALEAKLNEFGKNSIPRLPTFRPFSMTEDSSNVLQQIQKTNLESIMDVSSMSEREVNRQRVILELLTTEASYIGYLKTAVELFYSTAYALQKSGIMTDIDNRKLFSNIKDVLNANLTYWALSLYIMLEDAISKKHRFNTQLLFEGIMMFKQWFKPYEKFVYEQKNMMKYNRKMMETSAIYTAFLTWCESQKSCKRLKLSDIMVKPMQRFTKYPLLLKAICDLTDYEPEKTTLRKMYEIAQKYVHEVNLSKGFRDICDTTNEVIERLDVTDIFLQAKEDNIDPSMKRFLDLNLLGPVQGCNPQMKRLLLLQGDLRMKDGIESKMDVRVFLFTDVMLICSLIRKKRIDTMTSYHIIKPKYMVDRIRMFPYYEHKSDKMELLHLFIIVLDEMGTAINYFTFYDLNPAQKLSGTNPTLETWSVAIMEAAALVDMARSQWKRISKALLEFDSKSHIEPDNEKDDEQMKILKKHGHKAAKERMALITHGMRKQGPGVKDIGEITIRNIHVELNRDSTLDETIDEMFAMRSSKTTENHARSYNSSRASRLSSLQQSLSSTDYNEPIINVMRRSTDTSIDRRTISTNSDEWQMLEGAEIDLNSQKGSFRPPRLMPKPPILAHTTPNTLTVQPLNFGQSMPDLVTDQLNSVSQSGTSIPLPQMSLNVPRDCSQNLYLRAGPSGGTLGPDTRGISYPPPSPTRASLRRGFAFSSTFKNPLVKSKHISRDGSMLLGSPKIEKSPLKAPPSSPHTQETMEVIAEAINIEHQSLLPTLSTSDVEMNVDSITQQIMAECNKKNPEKEKSDI